MIDDILLFFILPVSIVFNLMLIWYSKRLLNILDENSVELRERFKVFHTFLDETYKLDLFFGEPRLKQLLDMVKEFDSWTREYESRIIREEQDGEPAETQEN